MSISPGSKVRPARSIRLAPAGTATCPWRPTAAMRPSVMTTRGLSISVPCSTSTIRSAVTATVSADAGAAAASAAAARSGRVFFIGSPLGGRDGAALDVCAARCRGAGLPGAVAPVLVVVLAFSAEHRFGAGTEPVGDRVREHAGEQPDCRERHDVRIVVGSLAPADDRRPAGKDDEYRQSHEAA